VVDDYGFVDAGAGDDVDDYISDAVSQSDFDTMAQSDNVDFDAYASQFDPVGIAQIIKEPIAGDRVGRSNILRTANYDPTFTAALQISQGLNPGKDSPITRPAFLQPQIEGRDGKMYFSPVEKFLQEDVTDFVQKGGIAGAFLSNLIKSGVNKGIDIVKDGYSTSKDFLENIFGIEDETKTNLAKEIATQPGSRVYDERLGFGTLDEEGKFIPDRGQDGTPKENIVPNLNSGIMQVSDNRGINFSNLFGTPRAQLNLPLDYTLGASQRNKGTLEFTSPRGIETAIGNIAGGDKQVDVAVPLGGGMALETRGIGEGTGASTTFSMNRPGMGFDVTKLPNDMGFTAGGRVETPYIDVFGRVNPGGGVNVGIGRQIRF
tara:strand:- start:129 stop:1253 length:1125 start_codon:yes stop_codon:yes gene_type:complete